MSGYNDFLHTSTERGGKLRVLAVIDEYTRECLALYVARSSTSKRVILLLDWLFVTRGRPVYLRSDNGSELIACAIQMWLDEQPHSSLGYWSPSTFAANLNSTLAPIGT